MIDYETYCQIRDCHQREGLKVGQIASALGLDARTVTHWINEPRYRPRRSAPRASKLDPCTSRNQEYPVQSAWIFVKSKA